MEQGMISHAIVARIDEKDPLLLHLILALEPRGTSMMPGGKRMFDLGFRIYAQHVSADSPVMVRMPIRIAGIEIAVEERIFRAALTNALERTGGNLRILTQNQEAGEPIEAEIFTAKPIDGSEADLASWLCDLGHAKPIEPGAEPGGRLIVP